MNKISKKGLTFTILLLTTGFFYIYSQHWFNPLSEYRVKGEQFSGGDATVFNESVHAFSEAAPNLTGNKDLFFVTGNAFFKRNWISSPASTKDLDGLGPFFNARSCSSCHLLDGKGTPPDFKNPESVDLLFRLSRPAPDAKGTIPLENYGSQFNSFAVLGVEPEGKVNVTYEETPGKYPDGTSYSLRKPTYEFNRLAYGSFPDDVMISPRIATHLVGLGLLEAIPDETLKSFSDPQDANNDGISGRINHVYDVENDTTAIGRFGWKANEPTVRQQVAIAFREDIGMTNALFSDEMCAENQADCQKSPSGGHPELTEEILGRVVLYSETIAVPARRNWENYEVLKGKKAFIEIGCSSCHIPKMKTGEYEKHPEFSNQTIFPYTDLLLHDMGESLADGRPDGEATGTEWRTPPLWGIGLIKTVSGHTNYLHDGRARNLEEAILWHGGEAEQSKISFTELPETQRENLILFLKSL